MGLLKRLDSGLCAHRTDHELVNHVLAYPAVMYQSSKGISYTLPAMLTKKLPTYVHTRVTIPCTHVLRFRAHTCYDSVHTRVTIPCTRVLRFRAHTCYDSIQQPCSTDQRSTQIMDATNSRLETRYVHMYACTRTFLYLYDGVGNIPVLLGRLLCVAANHVLPLCEGPVGNHPRDCACMHACVCLSMCIHVSSIWIYKRCRKSVCLRTVYIISINISKHRRI
jgi:hypothetical protein